MALFNYTTKEITIKVVYYGPGLGGKTTNLQYLHFVLDPNKKSKLVIFPTETDRTLFFDLLPVDLGKIRDFSIRFQLYTVPGQVRYNATRRLVLKGTDAIVFVADSQREMREQNIESFKNMRVNLLAHNIDPDKLPVLFQYNKRDLTNILSIDELNKDLNESGKYEYIEAIATDGIGVEESFRNITKLIIAEIERRQKIKLSAPEEEIKPAEAKEVQVGVDVSESEEEVPVMIKSTIKPSLYREEVFEDAEEIPVESSSSRPIAEPLIEKPLIGSSIFKDEPVEEMEEEAPVEYKIGKPITGEPSLTTEPTVEKDIFKSEPLKDTEGEEKFPAGSKFDKEPMDEETVTEKQTTESALYKTEPFKDVKEETPERFGIGESIKGSETIEPVLESIVQKSSVLDKGRYIIPDFEEETSPETIEQEPLLQETVTLEDAVEKLADSTDQPDTVVDNIKEILSTLKEMNDLMRETIVEQRKINIQLRDMSNNFEQIKQIKMKKRWFRF
ncbi:MAG: GTPase domain-containing protein [Nitrospirota bacterium]